MCACEGWRENWSSGFLRDFEALGGKFPSPAPSKSLPGHYMTLRDHLSAPPTNRQKTDWFSPSRIKKGLLWCPVCPSFLYTSAADRERHMKKIHGVIATAEPKEKLVLGVFECPNCKLTCQSKWSLKAHQRRNQPCAKLPRLEKTAKKRGGARGRFMSNESRPRSSAAIASHCRCH
jgi:hypothetical protein